MAAIVDIAEYRTFTSAQEGLLDSSILKTENPENTEDLISLGQKVHWFSEEPLLPKFFY